MAPKWGFFLLQLKLTTSLYLFDNLKLEHRWSSWAVSSQLITVSENGKYTEHVNCGQLKVNSSQLPKETKPKVDFVSTEVLLPITLKCLLESVC